MGLEPVSMIKGGACSPASGPANSVPPISQSQERATSTILPEGAPDIIITTEPPSRVVKPDIAVRLSQASPNAKPPLEESESHAVITSARDIHLGVRSKDTLDIRLHDPLVAAILAAFPDAKVVSQDVNKDSRAEESFPWEQASMDEELLDVVPHGFEREFWVDVA